MQPADRRLSRALTAYTEAAPAANDALNRLKAWRAEGSQREPGGSSNVDREAELVREHEERTAEFDARAAELEALLIQMQATVYRQDRDDRPILASAVL